MEVLELNTFWKNRRVLVTGHTGFKGAWLTLWLRQLGAEVRGVSLPAETEPGLLREFSLDQEIQDQRLDIRDVASLKCCVAEFEPEIVFHLAAQALVRRSYDHPVDTWNTNLVGSINLMEALRTLNTPTVAVMVTTDKVYQNREWVHGYREVDPVGGHDPYSSSKAAMEIAVESWRKSYFSDGLKVAIATARAGNVIGGGDYSQDRIVPDIIRSLDSTTPVAIRNPNATRPWQHVLEPLSGYMTLAENLIRAQTAKNTDQLNLLASPWNFGPLPEANRTVADLVTTALAAWPGTWCDQSNSSGPHEATYLGLSIDKAARHLNWHPRWSFNQAVETTVQWYRARLQDGACARSLALNQIAKFDSHQSAATPIDQRTASETARRAA